jgi:hypothetical protein
LPHAALLAIACGLLAIARVALLVGIHFLFKEWLSFVCSFV